LTEDHNPRSEIGGNNPPDLLTILKEGLEKKHKGLFDSVADLTLESYDIPKADEIKTDEDVARVNAIVVRIRAEARKGEKVRKEEKDEYLKGGRVVDDTLKDGVIQPLTDLATKLEQRSAPYLAAKRAEEEARRRAEQEAARVAAEEARERERVEREAARVAEEAAEAERQMVRQAADETARAEATERLRQAESARQLSQDAADQAARDSAGSTRLAETHERALTTGAGKLSRTQGGGAAARLDEFWTHTITDAPALLASLGPLNPFFSTADISEALNRCALANKDTVAIPGVRFFKDHRVRTSATKG
jgi:hypothetical protein